MSSKDLENLEEYKGELSGSIIDRAGTYLSELKEQALEQEKKKDENKEFTLLQNELLQIQNELSDLFDDISAKLDDFKDSRDRQNRMVNAENRGDFAELRHIFIDEYGMDSGKVNSMSQDELREQRLKFDDVERQSQAVIIEEIRELAKQYKQRARELGEDKPDLVQAELDKLDAIKYRCAAMGLDFDKIFDDTVQNGHVDFQLAQKEYGEVVKNLHSSFNRAAPNTLYDHDITTNEHDFADSFLNKSGSSDGFKFN